MRITSVSNQQIKAIRALKQRRERDRSRLFLVEGIRGVREAPAAPDRLCTRVVARELLTSGTTLAMAAACAADGGAVLEVRAAVFASLSARDGPQGIAAVVRQRWEPLPRCRRPTDVWVALCGVQHPGNPGAVVRTCDAAGAAGLILVGQTTDPYDPASLRASTGAGLQARIVRAGVDEFVAWSRPAGCFLVGTSGQGAPNYRSACYARPLVLLMGAERRGLAAELLAACRDVVRVPMAGRVDSLNLAAAMGVAVFEAMRAADAPVTPQPAAV